MGEKLTQFERCYKCGRDIICEPHYHYSNPGKAWFAYCTECTAKLPAGKWKYMRKVLPVEAIGMFDRVQVWISGELMGFLKAGESKEEAKVRLVLEAEQRINARDDIRAHLKGRRGC